MGIKLLQTQATKKEAGGSEQGSRHALAGPGGADHMPRAQGARRGLKSANLRLLREEDLGLAATGSLRRDLCW